MTEPEEEVKTYISKNVTCHFHYGKRTPEERQAAWERSMDYLYKECIKQGVKI